MEIANRNILITGASRGIGRAFAKMCAEDKAHLHLVLRRPDPELVQELEKAGAKSVTVWHADLADRSELDSLVSSLKDVTIDILFNNAGTITTGLLENQGTQDIYTMLQVNVNALIHLTHALLPGMLERKRGKIINNSSVLAYMHFPAASTYAATKAAVMAFTDCLRLELKDTDVTTLLLLTPRVRTRMLDALSPFYSKSLQAVSEPLSPTTYAQMIREAVLHDLSVLEPSGMTGLGLKVAKYIKPLFDMEMHRRFKR